MGGKAVNLGVIPVDVLEDVWIQVALGEIEQAKQTIDALPKKHPFEIKYHQKIEKVNWNPALKFWMPPSAGSFYQEAGEMTKCMLLNPSDSSPGRLSFGDLLTPYGHDDSGLPVSWAN